MDLPGPGRGDLPEADLDELGEHRPTAWALFVAGPLLLAGIGAAMWLGYEVPMLRRDVVRGHLAPGVGTVLVGAAALFHLHGFYGDRDVRWRQLGKAVGALAMIGGAVWMGLRFTGVLR